VEISLDLLRILAVLAGALDTCKKPLCTNASVLKFPPLSSIGTADTRDYAAGTPLQLSAAPSPGYLFTTGDAASFSSYFLVSQESLSSDQWHELGAITTANDIAVNASVYFRHERGGGGQAQ